MVVLQLPRFQSHKGLILTWDRAYRSDLNQMFQSHKGLILTNDKEVKAFVKKPFQSHKGLILTPSLLTEAVTV